MRIKTRPTCLILSIPRYVILYRNGNGLIFNFRGSGRRKEYYSVALHNMGFSIRNGNMKAAIRYHLVLAGVCYSPYLDGNPKP